ncbi:helix-turn-helix transcriptional regulator [Saccharothrix sp. 6-C]|uniref:ArsR/SmtB family transcription factor n=1 Tax=Saccharothrix sp. 6-C TaxID=2781735 RepID=UPI001916F6E5|nr:helix-turn-helix domain-containing protein [Saccharothrix sp. 6-C]QQQ78008.1 helix-turn-helix transcriptional regulator [Saccharothrix sp. 6-C]
MLKIYFTSADLARTNVAPAVDPLWEIVLSGFQLDRLETTLLRPWVHRLRSDPARVTAMRPGARVLGVLAPRGAYFPDFLTPGRGALGLDLGLEAVRSVDVDRLTHEVHRLGTHHPLPPWTRDLGNPSSDLLHRLVDTWRSYHEAVIRPEEDTIQAAVDADLAQRAHAVLTGGLTGLFDSLAPLLRWRAPVLEVDYPLDRHIHLGGRGLRLIPSYFCQGTPISLADPDLPPILVYPIAAEHRLPDQRSGDPLASLLGPTRAAVLHAVGSGRTTSELARRTTISIASASRHTAVLREAGLISSWRHGATIRHSLTDTGTRLLGRT